MENVSNYICENREYKILVVEDSKAFNHAITRALKEASHNVTSVFTLHEADTFIKTQEFDYILLDIILPDGEADILIDELPQNIKSKIIALSGDDDVQRRDYLFKAGILDYFSKINPLPLITSEIKKLFCTLETNPFVNVLVVDDSLFMRRTLSNMLKTRRFNTIEATNAKEGLDILKKNEVHLVLLDYEMPDMNGIEMLDKMKREEIFLKIPVIMISSNSSKNLVARILKHGANDFIAKPFSNEELLLKCNLHVRHYLDVKIGEHREKELQNTIKKVKYLEKNKSMFLANMSHEIRTPLNAVMGFIDLLKEESKNRVKTMEYLNIVESSSRDLLAIIEDILDFSKIESGKLSINKIDFSTRDEFRVITRLFDAQCSQKNILLSLHLDDSLPEFINSDSLRIKQIISNLISNAVKFTPKDKNITVNISYKDGYLHVSVKDEGIGIDKEKLSHIFGAFNQEDDSTTREFGGTGLGLSISSALVKLLGGELKVKSEKGKGSEFYFSLPASVAKSIYKTRKEIDIAIFENKTLLLVEDNKANQMFMTVVLKKLKLTFDIANDGIQAVDLYKQNHSKYDAILMDENMPNLNGIEATKQIRSYEKENNLAHTSIIALTANALKGDREKFLKAGMDEYLTKPINKEKLSKVLGEILDEK